MSAPVRICFVCSGNVCRSPTAEVALRRLAERSGRAGLVAVSSAGTGDWHAGEDMDPRSRRAMTQAGWDVSTHSARQFTADDFAASDVVVALDSGHRNALWWLASQTADVDAARRTIVLLRDFDPRLRPGEAPEVGDPYHGGVRGFTDVLEQIERSCAVLLDAVEAAVTAGADTLAAPLRTPSG